MCVMDLAKYQVALAIWFAVFLGFQGGEAK